MNHRFFRKWRKNPTSWIGLILVLLVVVMGMFAEWIAPFDPLKQDLENALTGASLEHWMGTDYNGRDIFSRIVFGARISITVGIGASLISLILGTFIGLISGFFGGFLERILMRFTDIVFGFPALLFMIALTAAFPPSLLLTFLAIGAVSWPPTARLIRAHVLKIRESQFITAEIALGIPTWKILLKHVIPNTLSPLIVIFTMGMANAVLAEASLSFLGLGAQPPLPSWGAMISTGREFLYHAPHISLWPGLAIATAVFGFNLLGDSLRDAQEI